MKLTKQTKNLMKPVKTVSITTNGGTVEIGLRQLNGAMRMERMLTICKLRDSGLNVATAKDRPEEAVNQLSTESILAMEEMRNKLLLFSIVEESESGKCEQVYDTIEEMMNNLPDDVVEQLWVEVMDFNALTAKQEEEIKADFPPSQS